MIIEEYNFWFGLISTLSLFSGIIAFILGKFIKYRQKNIIHKKNLELLRDLQNHDCNKFHIIHQLLQYNKKTNKYYRENKNIIDQSIKYQNLNYDGHINSLRKKLDPYSFSFSFC